MHSIRTKIILLFCGFILGVFILLAYVGIHHIGKLIETDNDRSMTMLLQQKSRELDVHFEGIERAVNLLQRKIQTEADVQKLSKDKAYRELFLQEIAEAGLEAATVSGSVYTLYFRMDPEQFGMDAGFFLTDNGYGDYVFETLTDLGVFNQSDREHVAWYYEPIESGEAIWLEPYMNENINVYMTSYAAPVYVNGKFIGVVGMDLDMSLIQGIVDSVDYLGGEGYLMAQNGGVVYNKAYPNGVEASQLTGELKDARSYFLPKWSVDNVAAYFAWTGKTRQMITGKLRNGMILAIMVPKKEIVLPREKMWHQMGAVFGVTFLLMLFATWRLMVSIVKPLRELTDAASRIARGEMNVRIDYQSQNEIGELADSIRIMERELREYIGYMHSQAYTDGMTGVGNKTSYLEQVRILERKISEDMAEFAVVVLDLNGLKTINDQYGHEFGDLFINDTAEALKRVFGAEHVYRIGGDEFIVILENGTREYVDEAFKKIDLAIEELNQEERHKKERLYVSKGAAVFKRGEDQEFKEVFKRADEAMYQNKAAFYNEQNDRRRR